MDENHLADLSPEEFNEIYLNLKYPQNFQNEEIFEADPLQGTAVNWIAKGAV